MATASLKTASALKCRRVLVIDDDPMVRSSLRETLRKWGHEVLMAKGPLDGFGVFCRDKPDVVLLDFYMPDGGAPAFLRELARTGLEAKLLIMSGSSQVGKALTERMAHAATFLPKPFHQTDFETAIARIFPESTESNDDHERASLPVTKGILADLNRRLRSGHAELPPLDPHLERNSRIFRNANITLEQVVQAVSRDPAVVAELVRVANLAAQRSGRSVSQVRDAVVQLGNREVANVLQEVVLRRTPLLERDRLAKVLRQMWVNTNLTAHLARQLGTALRHPRVQELHTAAMLHNIGELVIVRLYGEALEDAPMTDSDLTMISDQCTRNHERIGRRIFNRWMMPQEIRKLAGAHHLPASSRECTQCQRIVLLAWKLALAAGATYFPNQETDLDTYAEAERLHMEPEVIDGFLDDARKMMAKGYPLGSEEIDLDEVAAAAVGES
ncbi:MAG: HDOD domain-containing protein [Deltaproteobacteria bacterium]|nr:HDOD domain-containing protein [Deltaproteobacteria bacterium]